MKEKEKDIQSSIVAYLRLSGWRVFLYAQPGAHRTLGGILEPGHPDLLAIRRVYPYTRYLWVEVKRPGGKLSPDQERLHAELRGSGAWVEVWESVDDAIRQLAPLGLGLAQWEG